MRFRILTVVLLFALAACAEKTVDQLTYSEREALAESFIQNCEKQGLTVDDPEMVTCFRIEADRETKRREASVERAENIGMAISAGAKGYSDSSNRAASSYRRPVNCTSSRLGSTVNTTCY